MVDPALFKWFRPDQVEEYVWSDRRNYDKPTAHDVSIATQALLRAECMISTMKHSVAAVIDEPGVFIHEWVAYRLTMEDDDELSQPE